MPITVRLATTGVLPMTEVLDYGLLTSLRERRTLAVDVINMGPDPLVLEGVDMSDPEARADPGQD